MSAHATDPFYGKIVTVLGGSGFLGRHLAQELLTRGARLRVASRHPEQAFAVKALGNLGQVQFARLDVTRPGALASAFAGSDAVVNLVGAFSGNLDALQGAGAGKIAATAAAAGCGAFVHVSALGADAASSVAYARTKAEGEAAVLAAFPKATVLRPSVLFGPDDTFISMLGALIAGIPALPVFAPQARLQPLFVDDAAQAIAVALEDPATHGGRIYEIAGPEALTMLELHRRIARAECRKRGLIPLPDPVAVALATLPGMPISRDQLQLLKAGNLPSGAFPGLAELGIVPRPLGLFLDRWMVRFRKHGRFGPRDASVA